MDFLVDAGAIVNVKGVSARDAADLACKALGDRARFPIEVHSASGDTAVFAEPAPMQDPDPDELDKKPPTPDHGEFQKARA